MSHGALAPPGGQPPEEHDPEPHWVAVRAAPLQDEGAFDAPRGAQQHPAAATITKPSPQPQTRRPWATVGKAKAMARAMIPTRFMERVYGKNWQVQSGRDPARVDDSIVAWDPSGNESKSTTSGFVLVPEAGDSVHSAHPARQPASAWLRPLPHLDFEQCHYSRTHSHL